jgi:hypothetical protein
MIVDDLDIVGVPVTPAEADAPLVTYDSLPSACGAVPPRPRRSPVRTTLYVASVVSTMAAVLAARITI